MGIIELMQRALDKTNDPDAIFALDRGITEVERLREALDDMIQLVRKEYGSNDVKVQAAEAVLKGNP